MALFDAIVRCDIIIVVKAIFSFVKFGRTSVNVSLFCVSITSVDVLIDVVSGFGQKPVVCSPSIVSCSVMLVVASVADTFWRSGGLWLTFSNSSVSVSDSKPLKMDWHS